MASDMQAEILLRAARNSVSLGDIPEALSRLETLLQLEPRDDQARYEYAGLLLQAGRLLDGRRELEQLVATKPEAGRYRLALADVLMRFKEYSAARDQVRGLLSDKQLGCRAAITLARSLVLDRHFAEAQQFYDEHLRDLHDLDQPTQVALAKLLIDMHRPAEAAGRLGPLHRHDPTDAAIATTLAMALVRMNARLHALELLDQATSQPLDRSHAADTGVWLKLAAQLYQEHAFPEALAAFQLVADHHLQDQHALLGMARTHLRLYQVDVAKDLVDRYRGDKSDRDYTTVLIDYHTVVGQYAEAIALARGRLQADPNDLQAAILLADAYHASYQFVVADAAYRAALAMCPAADDDQRREIRRLQAKNYLLSHRLEAAVATLRALLDDFPGDIGSRVLLMKAWTELGCYDAAAALAHTGEVVVDPRGLVALQTELGYVRLKQGCNVEAAEQFRSLAANANDATPDVAYGLYSSSLRVGQPGWAGEALALGPSQLAPPATWGVIFAGRALSYYDCQVAAATLDKALADSPANLVLLNMRGEAALQCDCDCHGPECAIARRSKPRRRTFALDSAAPVRTTSTWPSTNRMPSSRPCGGSCPAT